MKRRLDSIIIGGAMLVGSIAHRRADHVAKHVDELEEAIEAVEDQLREVDARASERPPIPGMPLPTGYGLQVRGPDNEHIILPVCLPPGFELDSMVLCPEFLPRDQPQQAPVATAPPPQPVAPVAAEVPMAEPARTRARRDAARAPQRHAPVRLRQRRPGLQRGRDLRRRRGGRCAPCAPRQWRRDPPLSLTSLVRR